MKKLMILAAMFGFVACGGANKAAEEATEEVQAPEVEVVVEENTVEKAPAAAPEISSEERIENVSTKTEIVVKDATEKAEEVVELTVKKAQDLETDLKATSAKVKRGVKKGEQLVVRGAEAVEEAAEETTEAIKAVDTKLQVVKK